MTMKRIISSVLLSGAISGTIVVLMIFIIPRSTGIFYTRDASTMLSTCLQVFVWGSILGVIGAVLHTRVSMLVGSVLIGVTYLFSLLVCILVSVVLSGRMDAQATPTLFQELGVDLCSGILTVAIGLVPIVIAKALGGTKRQAT